MISSKPHVIALVGLKRCGKDTVANYLESYGYKNWKIASNLKQICKIMFGFTDIELESDIKDDVHPKWDVSPRYIMQTLGTEIVQHELKSYIPTIKPTFWVERLYADYINPCNDDKFIVISDMRFMHEYTYLKEKLQDDITIIKLSRNQSNDVKCQHISEQQWLLIPSDIEVSNDGTINDLKIKIKQSLKQVLNLSLEPVCQDL